MPQQPNKVALILCGGDINFSDLPIITNRSNAMIPVNGKPVIGWILEDLASKGNNEVILVLRFDNYKLFKYVEWAFAKRMLIHYAFVQSGGTILHSILTGLAWVKPNFGVHIILGDTLLRDVYPEESDFIFAGNYERAEDWCLVRKDESGNAAQYYDKLNTDEAGLFAVAGVYSLSDTTLLRNVVMNQIRSGAKEISTVLAQYGRQKPIAVEKAKEWYDFGHISYFNLAKRKLLQSRYFNSLVIDPLRGTISKRSEKKEKLADELAWYEALPGHLQLLCPRLIKNINKETITITQEYYGYPNLAELYVFGDIGLSVWINALRRLMEIHGLLRGEKGSVTQEDVMEMYGSKTDQRLEDLKTEPFWKSLLQQKEIAINGGSYFNFCTLKDKITEKVGVLSKTCDGSIIHGDYCFSNILYDLNSQVVRLIDPRGSFGRQKLHGDPRYDIAKLRHSISGRYDFILADLFNVQGDSAQFTLELFTPEIYESICQVFDNLVAENGYDITEIMFIEGLLFISMVPLHKDNFQRQLAMYLNGVMILNRVFQHANSN